LFIAEEYKNQMQHGGDHSNANMWSPKTLLDVHAFPLAMTLQYTDEHLQILSIPGEHPQEKHLISLRETEHFGMSRSH